LVTADLVDRARAGEARAFGELVASSGGELQVHRYPILGSALDAEDAPQETPVAAWPGSRAPRYVRGWTRLPPALQERSASKRPPMDWPPPGLSCPSPPGSVMWLEPYLDILLEGSPNSCPTVRSSGQAARARAGSYRSIRWLTMLLIGAALR
jgi:hypothetical protein